MIKNRDQAYAKMLDAVKLGKISTLRGSQKATLNKAIYAKKRDLVQPSADTLPLFALIELDVYHVF